MNKSALLIKNKIQNLKMIKYQFVKIINYINPKDYKVFNLKFLI